MAEWSNAAVLKTVELRGSGGSNPSLSAKWQQKTASSLLERGFLLTLCYAPPQAGRDVAEGEIPEEDGLLLAGNGLEIVLNLFSQEFNQRQMPVSHKEMSIHFKQRLL